MKRPAAATAAGRAGQRYRGSAALEREPARVAVTAGREPVAATVEREPAAAVAASPVAPRRRGSLGHPVAPPAERPARPHRQPRQRPERQRPERQPRPRVQQQTEPEPQAAPAPAPPRRRRSLSFEAGRELTAGLSRPHLPRLSELRPGSLLIDRIIRGRLWIPVLGVLLVAIVTMRVEVLRLDVRNTQATALAAELQSINQQQQARVSVLSSTGRIEALATRYGLHMPGPMDVHFVKSESGSSSQLKRAVASITKPDGSLYSTSVASEQAGNVASEASITGTTETTATSSDTGSTSTETSSAITAGSTTSTGE